jgi:hypothetical protein
MKTKSRTVKTSNKSKKKRILPFGESDLRDLAENVCASWLNHPQITMVWLTQVEFSTKVGQFSAMLSERKSTGSTRPQFTGELKLLDKRSNEGIGFIKNYLVYKYGRKAAPSYYAAFGMIKTHHRYKLPDDRNKRQVSIELLIPALTIHGFQNNDFGLTFWTDIKTNYDSRMQQAESIDSMVSQKVGNKNILKREIRQALNSLIYVLKGNYPQTHASVIRSWGFQKEKY